MNRFTVFRASSFGLAILLSTFTLTLATSAVAQASSVSLVCPAGSAVVLKCEGIDDPQKKTYAQLIMDGAVICKNGNAYSMLISPNGGERLSYPLPVKVTRNAAGAITYFDHDVNEIADTQIVVNPRSDGKSNATYSMIFPNDSSNNISRALSCKTETN